VPRRNDWGGERPDAAGRAQRKWMREHPRWPSSSCVTAHFGSWSAALQDAGLPARSLKFETSIGERVHAAQRLAAAGLGAQAIARALGVSRSSVHNYLAARDCPDCGGPMTRPGAERCAACAALLPAVERAWTTEQVRTAIRDWQAQYGRPPAHRDWTPSRGNPGRWEADSPRWPSAAVVCDLYGDLPEPWNAALRDAGVGISLRRWSDDSVRSALAEFWVQTARSPRPADLTDAAWHGPHSATLRRRYGGLDAAWSVLGPAPPTQ
jgi:hypothetical protein